MDSFSPDQFETMLLWRESVEGTKRRRADRLICAIMASYTDPASRPRLLSVEQCERLLVGVLPLHVYAVNFLVALCEKPWAVDPVLGSSGVAFFGNHGQVPADGADLLLTNWQAIRNHDRASFGELSDFL